MPRARRLRHQRMPAGGHENVACGAALPVHLFVSGRAAPQIPEPKAPTYNLPDAEFMKELLRLKGTPAEVLGHPELMQVMSHMLEIILYQKSER